MINKVQKILSEITTRKLCTMDEHMAFYNDTAKEDYRFLSEIEELIKDLQEEKGLALTIDDIRTIDKLLNKCVDCSDPYQEVLKRFKERKEK